MKKLTLLLCACAIALAGALVSCKNGPEEIVFTNSTSYNYKYTITGSIVEKTETGTPDNITETIVKRDIKGGYGTISWSKENYKEYDFNNRYFEGRLDYDKINADESIDYQHTDWLNFDFRPNKDKYKITWGWDGIYSLSDSSDVTITGDFADSVTITFSNIVNDDSTEAIVDKETFTYTLNLKKIGK